MKLLVSNRVETNYEIALLILLNGGIWRLQFDLIHDEEQVKGRLFTYKLLVYRPYRRKVKELEELKKKYDELNDSHLRLMAEFDNYRKRTMREKADLIKTGGEGALKNLLPIIDDFERALQNVRTAEDVEAVKEGVDLIFGKFMGYLSQQGVKPIEAIGKPFNTEEFEAIATIPAPEPDMKGKVLDCVQTGYTLFDKVIRHAKVVVGE